MTATIVRIGNSKGIVIPSRLLKSLNLSEKDQVEIKEGNGGLILRKSDRATATTPFTALDEWNAQHGFSQEFSLDETNEYVKSIRRDRTNKEVVEW